MSMHTIVDLNHDYTNELTDTMEPACLLRLAMASGHAESWDRLERFGVRRAVMVHHGEERAVVTRHKVFDLYRGTTYDNPEIELRKALRMIADGKSANPVVSARRALGRNPLTNEQTPLVRVPEMVQAGEGPCREALEAIEREIGSWETRGAIRLHCGELKASEMKVAKALMDGFAAALRRIIGKAAPAPAKLP